MLRVETAELTTPAPPTVSVAPERLLMRERLAAMAKAAVALPSSIPLEPWKITGLPPITTGLAIALAPVRAFVAESVPPLKLKVCVVDPPKRLVVRPRIRLPWESVVVPLLAELNVGDPLMVNEASGAIEISSGTVLVARAVALLIDPFQTVFPVPRILSVRAAAVVEEVSGLVQFPLTVRVPPEITLVIVALPPVVWVTAPFRVIELTPPNMAVWA